MQHFTKSSALTLLSPAQAMSRWVAGGHPCLVLLLWIWPSQQGDWSAQILWLRFTSQRQLRSGRRSLRGCTSLLWVIWEMTVGYQLETNLFSFVHMWTLYSLVILFLGDPGAAQGLRGCNLVIAGGFYTTEDVTSCSHLQLWLGQLFRLDKSIHCFIG